MSAALIIGIGILGGLGAVARFALDGSISSRLEGPFPFGTLAVNLLGTSILGVLVGAGLAGDSGKLLALGLLGGFTTFSTWVFESHRLTEAGLVRPAVWNLAASLVCGIAAIWLGQQIGGLI